MKNPTISILVLNCNGLCHLKDCFTSLFKQAYPNYKIFLIDNNSTDGSIEYTKKHFPKVKIIKFKENLGFAKAYNEAVKLVKENFLLFLNNDTKVDKDWLKELMNAMQKDDKIACCTSKIVLFDKPNVLNSAGGGITQMGSGYDIGFLENESKFNESKFTCACGCSMLIKRKVFNEVGGFDSSYFIYFEDTDLSWRIWLYGYKIVYVPTSVVYHKFGAFSGFSFDSPMRVYHGQKNKITNIIKNFEIKNLILAFIISTAFDFARIINFIRKGKISPMLLMLKADFYVLKNIRSIIRKRSNIQSKRKISDKMLKNFGVIIPLKESIKDFFRLYR